MTAHNARGSEGQTAYDVFGVPGDPEADERLRADLAAVAEAERRALRSCPYAEPEWYCTERPGHAGPHRGEGQT